MADLFKHSSTSNLIRFTLKHATTGVGLTGLSSASSGLIISTITDNEATATAYTVAGSTIETITTLGTYAAPTATKCRFKEVDATNHKGLYEFQFADARFSVASAKRLVISVTGATNLLDADYEIQLVQFDPYNATTLGLTNLDAAITSRMATYTQPTGFLAATFPGTVASTTNITAATGIVLSGVTHTGAVIPTVTDVTTVNGLAANVITAAATAADFGAEIADAVWDEATAGHTTAGTTGKALTDASSAGDPWSTALPGAYGAGTAGKIVGDNINATISSRLASASYTAPLDAAGTRSAVGLASANLDTQLDALPTAIENADALLDRNMATGTDSGSPTVRTPRQALRFLRNKWSVSAGTLTVTKEDDVTASFTATVTTDAAALPIIGNDPA